MVNGKRIPEISLRPSIKIIRQAIRKFGVKHTIQIILGFLMLEGHPPVFHDFLYINTIAVKSKMRNKGIGTRILNIADQIAKNRKFKGICLYVATTNNKAIKLYQSLGYRITDTFIHPIVEVTIGLKGFYFMNKAFDKI